MKTNKNKSVKAAAKEEKEFGSFELAWDSLKFYLSNGRIYLTFAAIIGIFMMPQVFFTAEKGQTPGIFFQLFGVINLFIMMAAYAFFVFLTQTLEKKSNPDVIDTAGLVKKTFSKLPWFLWTGLIFILSSVLFLAVCVSPAIIAINLLDIGPPVALIFAIPGMYMLFALILAPVGALVGVNNGKNPIKNSWMMTRGAMLEVFFALLAFFLVAVGILLTYMLASGAASFVVKFLFVLILGAKTGAIISGSIFAVIGIVFQALLIPFFAAYGFKFYKRMEGMNAGK